MCPRRHIHRVEAQKAEFILMTRIRKSFRAKSQLMDRN